MKTLTLGRIISTFAVGVALLTCSSVSFASKPPAPAEVVPMGNNTFSITRTATNGFNRDVDKLKAEAEADAAKYCADQGKQLKIVDQTSKKPLFSTGYASAKIVFQSLTADEIAQAAASQGTSGPGFVRSISTDELVSELTKLDDLRKKGILTDDEFQAEKKKILARSR